MSSDSLNESFAQYWLIAFFSKQKYLSYWFKHMFFFAIQNGDWNKTRWKRNLMEFYEIEWKVHSPQSKKSWIFKFVRVKIQSVSGDIIWILKMSRFIYSLKDNWKENIPKKAFSFHAHPFCAQMATYKLLYHSSMCSLSRFPLIHHQSVQRIEQIISFFHRAIPWLSHDLRELDRRIDMFLHLKTQVFWLGWFTNYP